MKHLFKVLFVSSIIIIATGCGSLNVEPYNVPEYITISHSDAMSEKFKTKKDVFTEFGAADKKDEYEGIEVWTYNLAERTIGVGTTLNISNTETKQNRNNPNLKPIDRSIVSSSTTVSGANISSTTKNDYVTFWFDDDKVFKWESLGYSASYQIKNSQFSMEEYKNYRYNKTKREFLTFVIGVITVVLVFGNGFG
jgi:hypothetical protein